ALTGLATIAGRLDIRDGAVLDPSGDLSVTGSLLVDRFSGEGGTTLPIAGTLTNSNFVGIGNSGLSAPTTVTAAGLVNSGEIDLFGGAGTQATLDIAAAAGFGTAGVLTGDVRLSGDALLEVASGEIATIASGASLTIEGAPPGLADASDTGHNSALTGLATIAGRLDIRDGAVLDPGGDLSVTGSLLVDRFTGEGGTTLPIAGTLTNGNFVGIGNGGLSAPTTVTAAGLVNSGEIDLFGGAGTLATLDITAAA